MLPGNLHGKEAAVVQPERIGFGSRSANHKKRDRNVDAKGDVLRAEDMTFGRSEVSFNLPIGQIEELRRTIKTLQARDDALNRFLDRSSNGSKREAGKNEKRDEQYEGNLAQQSRHWQKGKRTRPNYKSGQRSPPRHNVRFNISNNRVTAI